MADFLEITAVTTYTDREGNSKNQFSRIGTAWPMKNGGFRLVFNALPVPTMGDKGIETMALALPPKPKQDQQQNRGGNQGHSRSANYAPDDDSSIPF